MLVVLFMSFGLLALQDFKIVWHFNMQTMSISHEGFPEGPRAHIIEMNICVLCYFCLILVFFYTMYIHHEIQLQ